MSQQLNQSAVPRRLRASAAALCLGLAGYHGSWAQAIHTGTIVEPSPSTGTPHVPSDPPQMPSGPTAK